MPEKIDTAAHCLNEGECQLWMNYEDQLFRQIVLYWTKNEDVLSPKLSFKQLILIFSQNNRNVGVIFKMSINIIYHAHSFLYFVLFVIFWPPNRGGGESIIRKKNDFSFIAMVWFKKNCNRFLLIWYQQYLCHQFLQYFKFIDIQL